MEDKCVISVQVPDAVNAFLTEESEKRMTSKSAVVREILAKHLNDVGVDFRRPSVAALTGTQSKAESVTP